MPKPPLHAEPVVNTWRTERVHWHAYDLPAGHSRPGQRAERLAGLPVAAVLRAPQEVVAWVEGRHARHVPHSLPESWANAPFYVIEATAESRNYRTLTNLILASKGYSLYIELKDYPGPPADIQPVAWRCGLPTTTPLRELWIEAVREPDCREEGHAIPAQRDTAEEVINGQGQAARPAAEAGGEGSQHPATAGQARPKG